MLKKLKNYYHYNFSLCVIFSVTRVYETSLMYVISLLGSVFAIILLAVDSTTYVFDVILTCIVVNMWK